MRIHGLEARQGQTAFAFLVLRLRQAADRDALTEVIRHVAVMIPDAASFIAQLPDDLDESMHLVGMPWLPPAPGPAVEIQRLLIESSADHGVEAAWFFQTGTSLPNVVDDDHDGDDDDEASWSHGPPPQRTELRFPVDGYPEILEELDWEDFGIAFKLAGDWLPGESTVLLGFHALWLSPYGGRYRNAAVTADQRHHAAHLWVDRFAVPSSIDEQVHHLLWILSKIDEVTPVLHARFAGATMSQKYGGPMGDDSEPFVLGGNPLMAIHGEGGDVAVDAWIGEQRDWSKDEVAQMLRELAIELVTRGTGLDDQRDDDGEDDEADDEADDGGAEVDALFPFVGTSDDATANAAMQASADADDERGDADVAGDAGDDRGRHITTYAGEILAARAAAGTLDPRALDKLRPLLDVPARDEHRRSAVVEILGALQDHASVPQLVRILEDNPITSSFDSLGKEQFLAKTAAALGRIGDPAAIPALAKLVAAPGSCNDEPRPVAADALASCLAAAPEPRDVDDAVLAAMLTAIEDCDDGALNAELHFAYGKIARQLTPERRALARQRLEDTASARDDGMATMARAVALVLARGRSPDPATEAKLRPLIHAGLTELACDHDQTVRNIRVALRLAEVSPGLVDAEDLVWLTRFGEPDIRSLAHAVLEQLSHPMPRAPVFDHEVARTLDDDELVRWIGEPHLVGRAVLVTEAGRRKLTTAYPAIIEAGQDVLSRAREGGCNLLEPDARLLAAAVGTLRAAPCDAETIVLFDRMLRHSNAHVKWELLQAPPDDPRLIGGMVHVLAEKSGWQEATARQWLAKFQGTIGDEVERTLVGPPVFAPGDHDQDDDDDLDIN